MKTSVILCTRNRVDEVIRFTESLYNQIELPDEYIVVDSSSVPLHSNKKFVDPFEKMQKKIDLHYIYSKPGLTKQRNIGIKEATGDVLYFFDDDVILSPNFLQIMNKTFNDNPDYMGGMGSFIGMPKLTTKEWLIKLFNHFFLLPHNYSNGKFRKSGFAQYPYGTNEFKEVEVLGGGLTGYRKEIFFDFAFDENLTGYSYMEDVDFSRRVSYKYKLFYNPEAKLEHLHAESGRDNIRNNRKMIMVNHRYFFFKNFYPGNKLFIVAHWWSILGLIISSFIFRPKDAIEATKGYLDGLKEFKKRKGNLLCN